jgi:hypothetical protein
VKFLSLSLSLSSSSSFNVWLAVWGCGGKCLSHSGRRRLVVLQPRDDHNELRPPIKPSQTSDCILSLKGRSFPVTYETTAMKMYINRESSSSGKFNPFWQHERRKRRLQDSTKQSDSFAELTLLCTAAAESRGLILVRRNGSRQVQTYGI